MQRFEGTFQIIMRMTSGISNSRVLCRSFGMGPALRVSMGGTVMYARLKVLQDEGKRLTSRGMWADLSNKMSNKFRVPLEMVDNFAW